MAAQTLSGSHAEALEALVLGIAEEAYAASKLETEQREVRETAELIGIYWEQNASSARDCFSFLLDERTMPSRPEKQMLFSYRYQDGDGKPIFRKNAAVAPEKAQAYFSSIGQELRVLDLPVYPGVCPDGIVDSCIAATWQDSGYFHAGVTWTQPLLGKSSYKAAREQAMINEDLANNHIRVEKHQLERFVTEHYLLCLLDKIQIHFADSVASLLEKQIRTVQKLSENGMAKQSDVRLLLIEQQSNAETRTAFRQSYHTHLMDLNLLCGIDNTDDVALTEECLSVLSHPVGERSLFSEQYRLDSLNVAASLHSFNLQYKPRLDLFVNGGMQTGDFAGWYRHFGWSAGITFSWTIFDGRQKRWKERQVQLQQSSIQNYKSHAEYQRGMRISQCLSELAGYDERGKSLNKQLSEYEHVLSGYEKEMQAGQVSVLDYITVLRNKIQTERDYLLLQTNRQLVIAAYNYWNW